MVLCIRGIWDFLFFSPSCRHAVGRHLTQQKQKGHFVVSPSFQFYFVRHFGFCLLSLFPHFVSIVILSVCPSGWFSKFTQICFFFVSSLFHFSGTNFRSSCSNKAEAEPKSGSLATFRVWTFLQGSTYSSRTKSWFLPGIRASCPGGASGAGWCYCVTADLAGLVLRVMLQRRVAHVMFNWIWHNADAHWKPCTACLSVSRAVLAPFCLLGVTTYKCPTQKTLPQFVVTNMWQAQILTVGNI